MAKQGDRQDIPGTSMHDSSACRIRSGENRFRSLMYNHNIMQSINHISNMSCQTRNNTRGPIYKISYDYLTIMPKCSNPLTTVI